MKTRFLVLVLVVAVGGCSRDPHTAAEPPSPGGGVFVQLFEWTWPDVAAECEDELGPAGYAAVQISPPQEHIAGPEWWTRYQPVSYRVESRGGTREQFADMAARCKAAGVGIYADAIINHMAGVGRGVGIAGSEYDEFSYPVPYEYDDFHHCGRNNDDRIANYQDAWEVRNCQLGTLADLDTGRPSVQDKIGAYLNDLLSLGVAGFRLDAAKHMAAGDMQGILARVEGEPFVFQEVIDRGGEPITAEEYVGNGLVTEFRYAGALIRAFVDRDVAALNEIGGAEWLRPDQAVVFIDNHDSQRSHLGGDILNYKSPVAYDLATVFMLGYPYGYPVLMSSYAFDDDNDPVPVSSPRDDDAGCGADWVCEHRRDTATKMVRFRRATAGQPVLHWTILDELVSFGRGDHGHVVINAGEAPVEIAVPTGLPDGDYASLLDEDIKVAVIDGEISVSLGPRAAIVIAN